MVKILKLFPKNMITIHFGKVENMTWLSFQNRDLYYEYSWEIGDNLNIFVCIRQDCLLCLKTIYIINSSLLNICI